MATKKVAFKTATIDFSNSVEKIKSTTKTVNTEVVDTAIEVIEDIRRNGKKISQVATARVNEVIEKATLKNGVKFVKTTAESVNDYSVETVEEIVEEMIKGGKEWQKFAEKVLKGSVKLYGNQQDIVFETLEGLKKQYQTGNYRWKNLIDFSFFNRKGNDIEITDKVTKKTSTLAKKAAPKAKVATKVIKKAATKAKATAKAKATTRATKTSTKKATVKATKVAAKTTKPVAKKATTKKTTPKKVAVTKNNLRVIEGIGPKIESLLNQAGIYTFQQLAEAKQATLKRHLNHSRLKISNA